MDIPVKSDEPSTEGRALMAQAGDRATAGEIIAQTERTLDEQPALSKKAKQEATR